MNELEDMQKGGPMAQMFQRLAALETELRDIKSNWDGGQKGFGVYTPALVNVTNIAASTAHPFKYMWMGNMVHCAGFVQVDPTAAGLITLAISIPIASTFTVLTEAAGVASLGAVAAHSGHISADTVLPTNNRVALNAIVTDVANRYWGIEFDYTVQ